VQDLTPSKGVGFSCTTISKDIGCGYTARPSSHTPWGSYPAMVLVKIYGWRLCLVFPELLGDPT